MGYAGSILSAINTGDVDKLRYCFSRSLEQDGLRAYVVPAAIAAYFCYRWNTETFPELAAGMNDLIELIREQLTDNDGEQLSAPDDSQVERAIPVAKPTGKDKS